MRSSFFFLRLVVRAVCAVLSVVWLWCYVSVSSYAQTQPDLFWQQIPNAPVGVKCALTHNSRLFVGTIGRGIYFSDDKGQTWTRPLTPEVDIWGLAVSRGNIWAVAREGVSHPTIFRSNDNGATWYSIVISMFEFQNYSTSCWSIVAEGDTIVIGASGSIIRSTDAGVTWATIWRINSCNGEVQSLAFVGNSIVAGATCVGILRLTRENSSWTVVNTEPRTNSFDPIYTFYSYADTLIASGISNVWSLDMGRSWKVIDGNASSYFGAVLWHEGRYLMGRRNGVVQGNINQQQTWDYINNGLSNDKSIISLFRHRGDIFASTFTGLWRLDSVPITIPRLTAAPNRLTFDTAVVGGTRISKTYAITGQNLTTSTITITAPIGVEIATTSNGQFGTTLELPVTNGSLSATPIFVRLNSANTRTINGDAITHRAGSTSASVQVFGVVQRPLMQITATPQQILLDTIIHFDPSPQKTYTVTGANLTAPVTITAPDGILLFDAATSTWTRSLTLATSATGSVNQAIAVRLDSSQLRSIVNQEITHISVGTQASVRVNGAVVPLFLPDGAETTLELRLVALRRPMLLRDTARVQVWLKDSPLLTPRLIGRFLKNLRVTLRLDTNNFNIVGIAAPTSTRARFEAAPELPRTTPFTTLIIERVDTTTTREMLLAELLLQAALGATTTNTARVAQPTEWLGNTAANTARITWGTDSLRLEIVPLFAPRRQSALVAVTVPNPSNGEVEIHYTLAPSAHETTPLTLIVSDMAGRILRQMELGERKAGEAQQQTVNLGELATGAYRLLLVSPSETLVGRVDIIR